MAERSHAARKGARPAATAQRERRLRGIAGYVGDGSSREFDRLVHERVRLGMLSALAVHAEMSFPDLRDLLEVTDGNLSVHARKLEEAGYVACSKSFDGRVPRTGYRLTTAGRKALTRHLDHMEALIRATRGR